MPLHRCILVMVGQRGGKKWGELIVDDDLCV